MSSAAEIVHGNNTASPAGFSEGGQKDDSMTYTAHTQRSHGAIQGVTNPPASAAAEDKRFTTAYGMVVWPTLPGLSSSPAAAPVASAGAPTKSESAGLVHHHQSSMAVAAAARTAQTILPETNVETPNNIGGGEPMFSTSSTMLLRAACDACHRMKRKCDGKHPCTRCERRSRDCFYSYKQKSGPPKGSKRKLIEEEDDLPENRPIKPTLVRHVENAGAAPAATWPGRRTNGSGSSNGNSNGITCGETVEGRVGSDYGNRNASASSTLSVESAQQFGQVAAQQFSQVPAQQPAPVPSQHSVPASTQGFGQVSSAPVGPSPEARAAAAAAVAASRMNALAPVPPPLTAAGLRPSYMLQPPPALPGLSGGSGVAGGGVPAAAPMVTHQQYGSVYQHQYPPEVYAVYLAELRQRSTSCSGTVNSYHNTSNYNNPGTAVAATTSTPPPPAAGQTWEAKPSPAAPVETPAQPTNTAVEGGSTRSDASEAARLSQPSAGVSSGGPPLPGIGGGCAGGRGGAGVTGGGQGGDSGGSSAGSGGGVEPDTVALAPVAKGHEESGQGDGSGYSGKAGVAAASSEALAEAVAAAIAESSPKDGDAVTENTTALTYSAGSLNGDRSIGGGGPSGGGQRTPDPKPPLSPVKSNHLDFIMPRGDAGRAAIAAVSPKAVAAAVQAASSSVSPPAVASMQREKTELAAAGLLLYGARGQGGGNGDAGAENCKVREGQENFQS